MIVSICYFKHKELKYWVKCWISISNPQFVYKVPWSRACILLENNKARLMGDDKNDKWDIFAESFLPQSQVLSWICISFLDQYCLLFVINFSTVNKKPKYCGQGVFNKILTMCKDEHVKVRAVSWNSFHHRVAWQYRGVDSRTLMCRSPSHNYHIHRWGQWLEQRSSHRSIL